MILLLQLLLCFSSAHADSEDYIEFKGPVFTKVLEIYKKADTSKAGTIQKIKKQKEETVAAFKFTKCESVKKYNDLVEKSLDYSEQAVTDFIDYIGHKPSSDPLWQPIQNSMTEMEYDKLLSDLKKNIRERRRKVQYVISYSSDAIDAYLDEYQKTDKKFETMPNDCKDYFTAYMQVRKKWFGLMSREFSDFEEIVDGLQHDNNSRAYQSFQDLKNGVSKYQEQ